MIQGSIIEWEGDFVATFGVNNTPIQFTCPNEFFLALDGPLDT